MMKHILIVEDDAAIRTILQAMLKMEGYLTDVVITSQEAQQRIQQGQRYDLILLDLNLPDGLGTYLLRYLDQQQHWHIPVIMMSASGQPSNIEQGFALGASDFIVKPINIPDLLQRIELLTEHHVAH